MMVVARTGIEEKAQLRMQSDEFKVRKNSLTTWNIAIAMEEAIVLRTLKVRAN
jgi:hypothetical protein